MYGLFAEGYYAGIPLRHVDAGTIPESAAQVFVISDGVPADTRRLWTKVHEIKYRKNRLLIYRGQIIRSDDNDDDI